MWVGVHGKCVFVCTKQVQAHTDVCIRELEAEAPKQCLCVHAPLLLIREFDDKADGSIRIAWGYGSIAGVAFVVHVPLIII